MLIRWDIDIFYWINSHHTPWLDWVMWVASQGWSWAIVLVAAIVYLTMWRRKMRNEELGMRNEKLSIFNSQFSILLGIGLCFLFSDRISVLCFKDVFCRLRPCHALENVRMFHTSCGGQYGFVSSHAANVFALALFLSLWHRKIRNIGLWPLAFGSQHPTVNSQQLFSILLFLWACLVCYSRPYLGKHYPGDVICGALLGLAVGFVVFLIIKALEKKLTAKKNTQK